MTARKVRTSADLLSDPTQTLPREFVDTEIIADPLNQLIPISSFEKRIICCPEFQRLRRIKQLGFANFAYPAAEYSRFVHSLGACHQAKNIVDTINENLRNQPRYRQWRLYGRNEGNPPPYKEVAISPFERVIIAAAGLLHDLPHGPFSHEIEGILGPDEKPVIPDHDKVGENPALFLYLFDQRVSDLAVLLAQFNRIFAPALLEASKTIDKQAQPSDWRVGIKSLHDAGIITSEGNVAVRADSPLQPASRTASRSAIRELPLLPVLIFEVLLFEKQQEWLPPEARKSLLGVKDNGSAFGVEVITDWEGREKILWQPLPGWFRAYRKDIIGDTICADLIDYVSRDGYHTGIVSTMDLKFLDRMLIARAALPPIGEDGQAGLKPSANRIAYKDIPEACEHVVFDIYDHKRGFIRQSVLTEILAFLQGRYLLCERVYVHRVVEAARSMLQKAVSILCRIEKVGEPERKLLEVRDLHPLEARTAEQATSPLGDEGLLTWIRALPTIERATYEKNRAEIDDAIDLAQMLTERRVFREAIIYDGIHGFERSGQLAGAKHTCRALEAAFLTDAANREQLEEVLAQIDGVLTSAFAAQPWFAEPGAELRLAGRIKSMVSVRKWGKRYKPPLVLVARPLKEKSALHSALDIEPLLDCEDPPNIKKQLDAMKDSYDGLWKVYLFVHPLFHDQAFIPAHREIDKILAKFAAERTGATWRNAIDFEQLLSGPIDNPSFLAQREANLKDEKDLRNAIAASEALDADRIWTGEEVMAVLRPLTAKDADNLQKIEMFSVSLAERTKSMTPIERASTATTLRKLATFQPKKPFILNRLGRYDADAIISRFEKLFSGGDQPR